MQNVRSKAFRRLTWAFGTLFLGLVLGLNAPRLGATTSAPPPQVYLVQEGDRLWDLASRLAPEDDPREFVQEMKDLNGLRDSSIMPGQKLFLPSG